MSTIRFLGFTQVSETPIVSDLDLEKLLVCLSNGWPDGALYTWIRALPDSFEVAFSMTSTAADRQVIETLIKVDPLLESFRMRKFQVGEIMPGDLGRYVLITLKREGSKQ